MDHLREIAKIAEWGLKKDPERVIAYVNQLILKLEQDGDDRACSRLRVILEGGETKLGLNRISPSVPVDGDSRLGLADEVQTNSNGSSVVLNKYARGKVDEFISLVNHSDDFVAEGVYFPPTMLLYGPPGCGKSRLAKEIACTLKLPLLVSRVDTLVSSYLGSTSKNIRSLFEHVAHRRCILFLDELDALGKLRDDRHELGELKRVVVSLLQNLDSLESDVIVLGATNHPHLLDSALWRRFSVHLEISFPESRSRRMLFDSYLRRFSSEVDLDLLAAISDGLSGSEIELICGDAIRHKIVCGDTQLDEFHLLRRIAQKRLKIDVDLNSDATEYVGRVRNLCSDHLNADVLSGIFSVSKSTIYRRIKEEGENA